MEFKKSAQNRNSFLKPRSFRELYYKDVQSVFNVFSTHHLTKEKRLVSVTNLMHNSFIL